MKNWAQLRSRLLLGVPCLVAVIVLIGCSEHAEWHRRPVGADTIAADPMAVGYEEEAEAEAPDPKVTLHELAQWDGIAVEVQAAAEAMEDAFPRRVAHIIALLRSLRSGVSALRSSIGREPKRAARIEARVRRDVGAIERGMAAIEEAAAEHSAEADGDGPGIPRSDADWKKLFGEIEKAAAAASQDEVGNVQGAIARIKRARKLMDGATEVGDVEFEQHFRANMRSALKEFWALVRFRPAGFGVRSTVFGDTELQTRTWP